MPPGKHWRRPTRRRDGAYVRGTWVRNQGRHQSESPPPRPPSPPSPPLSPSCLPPQSTPRRRSKRRKAAIAIAATLTIGAGAASIEVATSGNSASASSGVTVQANISLKQVVAALQKLQFAGTYIVQPTASNSSTGCAKGASGDVKQFLTIHPYRLGGFLHHHAQAGRLYSSCSFMGGNA